ncbi:MAG: hypothetical protein WCP22_11840 [Chlamydiota bacterium]
MTVVSGIRNSQTTAPAWLIWLVPKWPVHGIIPKDSFIPLPANVSSEIEEFSYTSVRRSAGTASAKMDTFEIVVNNRDLQFLDTPWFQEGNIVDMQWGYAPDNISAHKLGMITGVEPAFPENGEPVIVVKGTGLGCVMAGRERYGLWTRVNRGELPMFSEIFGIGELAKPDVKEPGTDELLGYAPSEIAIALAEAYGFKHEVEYCGPIQPWWQCGESDWAFLQRLAKSAFWRKQPEDVDFCCYIENGTLHFHSIKADVKRQIAMRMAWYCDDTGMLYSFRVRNDTTLNQGAASETTAFGYDPRRVNPKGFIALNKTVTDRVAFGSRTGLQPGASGMPKNQAAPVATNVELDQNVIGDTHTVADEKSDNPLDRSLVTGAGQISRECPAVEKDASDSYNRAGAAQLDATAECVGWPTLEAEKLLEIQCVGSKHSGIWEIDEITHRLGKSSYRCEMKLIRNAKGETIDDRFAAPVNDLAKKVESPGDKIKIELRPTVPIPVEVLK